MKQNRNEENDGPENDTDRRFHIEDNPGVQDAPPSVREGSITSGQLGPKSKRRFSAANGPPVPAASNASPPERGDSGMPGIASAAKPKQRFSVTNGPSIPEKLDAPASARDSSSTSGQSKYRPHSEQARFSDRLRQEEKTRPGEDGGPADKKAARNDRRFEKSKFRAEKTGAKLDAAHEKAAAQKPSAKPNSAKANVKKAVAGAWYYAHQKIHEVEQENVGVEAAHKTELAGEKALRGGMRFVKHRIHTSPARRVDKWERRDIRAKADFEYRRMAREHPELKDNALSRYFQKQRIKKQYQKQAREAAKQGARAAGKAATATGKLTRAAAAFIKRHPAGLVIALIAFLLIVSLQSCMASMVSIGNGLIGAMGAGTYPSADSDMLAAEAAYSGMETKLQNEAQNYATLHPGYDEYRYDLDTVEHDPYVLISILSALNDGVWTVDGVQDTLSTLFAKQYQLTQPVQTEVRYRTEIDTVTNPDGTTETVTRQVPYNYTICTVTLHNEDLSHIPVDITTEDQLSRYALYMKTLGNRPDLFPQSQYPNASTLKSYTDYDIPAEYMSDETFAAMITEAKKYLGYPYVWGGSSPETSFDCSGYVSWVLNHSGWNVGRLSAQGLYNVCTPIPASSAKPGDLVFFVGTYDTPGISHVGIYVGDGMMIAAGDPIGYSDITTSYWQSHFYAFGRLS
ncbi:CD1108 family mobile element protein [Caproiciproducens sp.]